jgi:hypothetical protein
MTASKQSTLGEDPIHWLAGLLLVLAIIIFFS